MVVPANYKDNPWFPSELEEERLYDLKHNPSRYYHIWEGEYEPRAIGSIWDRSIIAEYRRTEAPAMGRIVVAVDPPKKSDEGSNQAGIVVAGIGQDGRGYVLHDGSKVAPP